MNQETYSGAGEPPGKDRTDSGGAFEPHKGSPFTGNFWANMPIPQAHVAALLLGGALEAVARRPIGRDAHVRRLAGLLLLPSAVGLIAWAMAAAGDVRIDRPEELVTRGPYTFSRNPMYLGWALISLGISFLVNSRWLLAASGAAALFQHLHEIPQEEASLLAQFGAEYAGYRQRTRRYL